VSRRTCWSAVLSSCRVAALQACETSRLGPHSPIRDQGSLCAQFRRTQCFHDLRTVPLSDRFVLTKAMSGSAPPSPSMMKDTTVLSILLEPPFTASLAFSAIKLRSYSTVRCVPSIHIAPHQLI